jgi:hypothetical protein
VARIRVTANNRRYHVTMSGRLSASDLRRLERACGPALEQEKLDVTLTLTSGSSMDDSARAFVKRLVDRGAELVTD